MKYKRQSPQHRRVKGAETWSTDEGFCPYPGEVFVEDKEMFTLVLDADGYPYLLDYDPVGFDLRPKQVRDDTA